ncbi:MAG: hypothetical protein WBQ59_24380, partial [Candidatus Acidiferrum sp.]
DEDFAVLKGAHRTGIDVQVRIAFLDSDSKAATFEETSDGRSCYALAKRRNNTAGNKNIFWRHPGRSRLPGRFELVEPPQD